MSSSSLDYLELCRLCLVKDRVQAPIFEEDGDVNQIFLKIHACLPVKVSRDDKLPKKICDDCLYNVNAFYQFWNTTANAEKQLLQWLGEVEGLEDKQGYVTEVLDSNVMKQEHGSDNRLDGSVMQVSGHQNMGINMIENMSIITMPAGSEHQFTTVPIDTGGTVQTVQVSGPSTQTAHDQTGVTHLQEVEVDDDEDNMDDGCDNDDGLPVKEETDEGERSLEQTYVSLPCDEAGPSGLQQQKISEMSEITIQQTADGDPKTGEQHGVIGDKVPRILLPRWNALEIEMMKAQLREYHWLQREENNNNRRPPDDTKKHHRKKRRSSTKPYCRNCRRYFKSLAVLYVHRRVCLEKIKREPEDSSLTYRDDDDGEESANVTADEDEHREEVAQQQEVVELEEEILADRVELFEVRPLIFCKDCKLAFGTTHEIFEHRQYLDCAAAPKDEESELSEATDDEYGYDRLYACPVCRAKFVSSELLMIHREREKHVTQKRLMLQRHENETTQADFTFRSLEDGEYECASCVNGFVYYDPDDLIKHHRAVHSAGEKRAYCRYCAHKLSGIGEFVDHHRLYHEMQRHCRVCNDRDDEFVDLQRLPPKPICLGCSRKFRLPFDDCLSLYKENLYCDDCERAVPTVAHFRFHNCTRLDHFRLSVSLLVCPLCLEPYNSLRSLYRHIIQHNDVKAFRCEICGKLHDTWKALKVHAMEHHFVVDVRLPTVGEETLRKTAEDVIRRFVKNGVELLI